MKKPLNFLKGATIGALLGSVVALLLGADPKKIGKDIIKITSNIAERIATETEKAKGLTKDKYEGIVDKVVGEYSKDKKIAQSTLKKVNKELKAKWLEVKKEFGKK